MSDGLTMVRRETSCDVMASVYFREYTLRKHLSFNEKRSKYLSAWRLVRFGTDTDKGKSK